MSRLDRLFNKITLNQPLFNPERDWESPPGVHLITRAEIEGRMGPLTEKVEILAGGLLNANVRIGEDKVLRIYRQVPFDPQVLRKERALMGTPWTSFKTLEVLMQGDDFLMTRFTEHSPILDSAAHGAALGVALAEIHSTTYEHGGFIGPEIKVVAPFHDFVETLTTHVLSLFESEGMQPYLDLRAPLKNFWVGRHKAMTHVSGLPVLLHGDFKASNLFWTEMQPLLLDWEFAYAGPALMDIGQLFRWDATTEFCEAFEKAYQTHGGQLMEDWRHWAEAFDLFNLVSLLENAPEDSRRAADLRGRIREVLRSFA